MKNFLPNLAIVATLILFFSCDPHSEYKKIVNNSTKYSIKIVGYSNPTGNYVPYDSFTITPGSKAIIRSSGGLGSAPPCVIKGDSIIGTLPDNSSFKINKNLNKAESWQRIEKGSGAKGYIISCDAIITDADIVPK